MAATADTTAQNYYDGFGKGLPVGIRDMDTDGKTMLVLSAVIPGTPVAGSMYFNAGTNALYAYNGSAWKSTTLA